MPGMRDTINCGFTACRLGFRRCWQWIQCHKPLVNIFREQYNVLCVGLSGSGKSTLLQSLVGESATNVEPTTGFNIKTLPIKGVIVSIKELGGSHEIQPYWGHYFSSKNGILFVVNAASEDEELLAAREVLKTIFGDARLKGRPCLILGTHLDLLNSKSNADLEQYFQSVMHGRKWRVVCCSAYDRDQIISALEYLIDMMLVNDR